MANDLVHPSIRGKLSALQRALRVRLAGEGVAWVALALVGVVLLTLCLDYFMHLPIPMRIGAMVVCLAGTGFVTFRQLLVPAFFPVDSENLALLVERRFKDLGDRLISALQFSRQPALPRELMSAAMIERVACEANDIAARHDFQELVERRGMWQMLGVAMGAVLLVGVMGVVRQDVMKIWFQRNVLMQNIPWPQRTYLEVRDYKKVIVRGSDLSVDVVANGVKPDSITVWAPTAQVGDAHSTVAQSTTEPGVYKVRFQAVSDSFEFWVTGGDDSLDKEHPHQVTVVDRPTLVEANFDEQYDDYYGDTHAKPEVMNAGKGVPSLRVGSKVTVTAIANKDLTAANFQLLDRDEKGQDKAAGDAVAAQIGMVNIDSKLCPRQVQAQFMVPSTKKAVFKTVRFNLSDTDNLSTDKDGVKYQVQITPDAEPTFEVKPVSVGIKVTPTATIPLSIVIKDDGKVASADVICVAHGQSTTQPVTDSDGTTTKPAVFDSGQFKAMHRLPIQNLNLQPGETVQIYVQATDNLPPRLGGPNAGRSDVKSFTVTRPEDLGDELMTRYRTLLVELFETQKTQNDATDRSTRAKNELKSEVTVATKDLLRSSSRQQADVKSQCSKVMMGIQAIHDEMVCNGIGTAVGSDILPDMENKVLGPLDDIQKLCQAQIEALEGCETVGDADALRQKAGEIAAGQQVIGEKITQVINDGLKNWTRGDMANRLKQLLDTVTRMRGILDNAALQGLGVPALPAQP